MPWGVEFVAANFYFYIIRLLAYNEMCIYGQYLWGWARVTYIYGTNVKSATVTPHTDLNFRWHVSRSAFLLMLTVRNKILLNLLSYKVSNPYLIDICWFLCLVTMKPLLCKSSLTIMNITPQWRENTTVMVVSYLSFPLDSFIFQLQLFNVFSANWLLVNVNLFRRVVDFLRNNIRYDDHQVLRSTTSFHVEFCVSKSRNSKMNNSIWDCDNIKN